MGRYLPRAMREAPVLDERVRGNGVQARYALLINPFYPKDPHASFGKHVLTPTLALTSVAAATPGDWTVQVWDENLLQGPPPGHGKGERIPQVVGITVHLTFAKRAYALAKWYRKRGSKVVFGGLHVLSCPDEVMPHADAIVVGEGVQCWGRVLRDAEAGELKREYSGSFMSAPYKDDPAPRRDLLDRRAFLTTTSMIATRGCHNRCGFCYLATEGLKIPYQMRTPEQVAAEFVADGQPYGVFTDNNLGSKRDYLRALCGALKPLEKIWSAAVSIDVTDEPSLIRQMALAGCNGVFIGLESLTDENLSDAKKKTPRTADYARRIKLFHDVGIQINGSFVLGFDHDRPGCFEKLIDWIEENRLECSTFHILTPYPGTPLFRQMEREGRLLHRDWEKYDTGHVVFQPKHMTAEELQAGYEYCYQRLFSHGSIWKRRPENVRAVPGYLAMSYLYKKSNLMWPFLIRHRLTGLVWKSLVERWRRRHVAFRQRLEAQGQRRVADVGGVVSAGV